ncbi:hypothetical protein IAI10_13570 [Clostridium sp. 19966]|uniref:DUF6171 family protein n=1 Tax=Clostridium sp. 19966 TaxID=2768166 RepID=UPI0028E014AA|nr:DUF6171 family protein [Clostridium sp. 19966]MDT8717693.1 hypothetical protein [Clostridium sp. 19966]
MAYIENCKGCSASVRIVSEDIKKMIDEIVTSNSFDLVSQNIYNDRIVQCSSCTYLDYDTTCRQCGCIVQIRALLANKDCPNPSKSKWQKDE